MGKTKSEEAFERQTQEAVELGRKNAEIIGNGHKWCKHFRCEITSYGMLAEMYQLPIGSHRVSCKYTSHCVESMNLPWIIPDFIIKACSQCEARESNGGDFWGNEILRKHEEKQEENRLKNISFKEKLRNIREEKRKIPVDAKLKSKLHERQILSFAEDLFADDNTESSEAFQSLVESAKIGADLFTEPLIDLLISQFDDALYSKQCIDICIQLIPYRKDLHERLVENAKKVILYGRDIEEASSLIVQLPGQKPELNDEELTNLIGNQFRRRIFGDGERGPKYVNATKLIALVYDKKPSNVVGVIKKLLLVDSKESRVNICKTIQALQLITPGIGLDLLPIIVDSLELPDDRYEESADGCARKCIEDTFLIYPEEVDSYLKQEFEKRRVAVKDQIISIYNDLARSIDYSDKYSKRKICNVGKVASIICNRSISLFKSSYIDVKFRLDLCEAFNKSLRSLDKSERNKYFDNILGYYTTISEEDLPPKKTKIWVPGDPIDNSPQLDALEAMNEKTNWSRFKSILLESIGEIALGDEEHLNSILKIYETLDSVRNNQFKAGITTLLGKIGKESQLLPKVLPTISHALMDGASQINRANALYSLREIYMYSGENIPENIADAMILHLIDSYVVVHKSAVEALNRCNPYLSDKQKEEALVRLSNLGKLYINEPYFLKDIFELMLKISGESKRFFYFSISQIKSTFPTKEMFVDYDIVESLLWRTSKKLQVFNIVIDFVLYNINTYGRDKYNSYEHSKRKKMFDWLFDIPKNVFEYKKNDILIAAQDLAKKDPWESLHFSALFNQFEEYYLESKVLTEASKSTSTEVQTKKFSKELEKVSIYAMLNHNVCVRNREGVSKKLQEFRSKLSE